MVLESSDQIVWYHTGLVHEHPPEELVAREEEINVGMGQVWRVLPPDTDVASGVQGRPLHGVGGTVLERHAKEFHTVLSL